MKKWLLAFAMLTAVCVAQTCTGSNCDFAPAFPTTSTQLTLSPITLPGLTNSVAGAETDVLISPSPMLALGETTLTSTSMVFAGGRFNYVIKPVSTWIQNHSPNLNGYQFQFGLTGSVGVVKPVGNIGSPHWGERAGGFLNYAINGQWGAGVDIEWGNFPGVQHNTWTFAVGPNFHF